MALTLQFKFRAEAASDARREVLASLKEKGAGAVRPLFPREADAELSAIYSVTCPDEKSRRELLRFLGAAKAVEFAEPEVRRRPK